MTSVSDVPPTAVFGVIDGLLRSELLLQADPKTDQIILSLLRLTFTAKLLFFMITNFIDIVNIKRFPIILYNISIGKVRGLYGKKNERLCCRNDAGR